MDFVFDSCTTYSYSASAEPAVEEKDGVGSIPKALSATVLGLASLSRKIISMTAADF